MSQCAPVLSDSSPPPHCASSGRLFCVSMPFGSGVIVCTSPTVPLHTPGLVPGTSSMSWSSTAGRMTPRRCTPSGRSLCGASAAKATPLSTERRSDEASLRADRCLLQPVPVLLLSRRRVAPSCAREGVSLSDRPLLLVRPFGDGGALAGGSARPRARTLPQAPPRLERVDGGDAARESARGGADLRHHAHQPRAHPPAHCVSRGGVPPLALRDQPGIPQAAAVRFVALHATAPPVPRPHSPSPTRCSLLPS